MARPLRIELPGALYHLISRGNERRRIVRHDADRQKWIEWLRRTVDRRGWRERRQPRDTPRRHGTGQFSRATEPIFTGSDGSYSLITA